MNIGGILLALQGAASQGILWGVLVLELRGFWFVGIIKVLVEFVKNIIQNRRLEKRLYNYK